MEFTHEKGALRETITARRRAWKNPTGRKTTKPVRDAVGAAWNPGVIALYASRKQEPGTLIAIRRLLELGWQVLLPKLSKEPDWAWATGELRPGWAGIPEPTDQGLGIGSLALADVIVVPCLAVSRDGTRLGMGGGWYDRALHHRRPGTPVWALANSDEVLPRYPMNRMIFPWMR